MTSTLKKEIEAVEKSLTPVVEETFMKMETPVVESLTPLERIERNKEFITVLAPVIQKHHLASIQGKNYMKVGGGIAVANALGYAISVGDVTYDKTMGVYKAMAELRCSSSGVLIASAVGYVGDDESRWSKGPVYARLSMTQTRAEAKLCRANFGSVYMMLGASTDTPAEEMSGVTQESKFSSPPPNNGGTSLHCDSPQTASVEEVPPQNNTVDIYVDRVETKTGTAASGSSWELYLVCSTDGNFYSTFNPHVRDEALEASQSNTKVSIVFETSKDAKGNIRQRIQQFTPIQSDIPF
mgnify:CR=1 FL=1|tara:strand:+ start:406 stop:1296 length:891 start_codon:yes stop_codon:yes gene_type:complete